MATPGPRLSDDDGLPPLRVTVGNPYMAGQWTAGSLIYVVFSDHQGPLGVLWRATTPGDEACGWQPHYAHPHHAGEMFKRRLRISLAQGFSYSADFDPEVHESYTAERFFNYWVYETSYGAISLTGPGEFDGGSSLLADHLGWPGNAGEDASSSPSPRQ